MQISAPEFVSPLATEVPETNDLVDEQLADHEDEMLLHLLMGDLRLRATDWFHAGRMGALGRLLTVLDRGLRDGDEYVVNAVAVSFVEDLGWWEPAMQPLMDVLPTGLLAEVERQRHHGL